MTGTTIPGAPLIGETFEGEPYNPAGPDFATWLNDKLVRTVALHMTVLTEDTGATIDDNGGAFSLDGWTLSLDEASILTAGWHVTVLGPGVIEPDTGEGDPVNLADRAMAIVVCDGTAIHILQGARQGWRVSSKAADEARNTSTSLTADSDLTFPIAANEKVRFRGKVFYDTPATADFKFDVQGPASPSLVRVEHRYLAPGATAYGGIKIETAFAFTAVTIGEAAGTSGSIDIEGVIHNGSNAGTVAFRWAQNASDASDTTVSAGSYLEYEVA